MAQRRDTIALGRLEPVDPRHIWLSESGDFTPWLAEEANLKLLGDAIGLDLELESVEQGVGPFRADIVCKDTATGSLVLVENQLERTDHTHLGQLLTYAAGLTAVTIVWIAKNFTEEHRAALDWLNNVTSEEVNFFGLEVQLWRIGDSSVAPKFNLISKPNDWIKEATAARQPGASGLTPTKQLQIEYWTHFQNYLRENSKLIKPRKPFPDNWVDFAIGRTDFSLQTVIRIRERSIGVSLAILGRNAKPHYYLLYQQKSELEAELNAELTWWELPTKKSSYISLYLDNADPADPAKWPAQHQWLLENLEAFHRCFAKRVKLLDVGEYAPTAGQNR